MKKIVQISEGKNALTLVQKGKSKASYVKVFDSKKKLIRHSRSSANDFTLTMPPGKYFIETDGDFETGDEISVDENKSMKSLYKHLEIDLPNNMLTLKGRPFYQTEDLGKFLDRIVKDKKELQGYFEAIIEKAAAKARKKIFNSDKAAEALLGTATPTEKAKIKKSLADVNKEKKRVITALKKSKNANELLKIKPKFRRLNF